MFAEELARDRQRLDTWLEKTFSSKENGVASSLDSFTDYDAEIFDNVSMEHEPAVFGGDTIGEGINEFKQDIKRPFQILTFLCSEIQLLESYAKKKFYPSLYVVGKSTFKSTEHKVGDSELHLATMLPMLQDVSDLLEQLDNLLTNIFRQISAIILEEDLGFKRRIVYTGLRYISRGLIVLMTIQTLISLKILPLFFDYRRMLHTMMAKTDVHGVEMSLLEDVQHQVLKLEESLRLGAFTSFIDSKLKDTRLKDDLKKKRVSNIIENYIKETVESLLSQINLEEEVFGVKSDILGTLILFITYLWLGSYSKDKKLLNIILEIHEKAPILPLYGNLIINPSRLILEMMPDIYLSYLSCDYLKRSNAHSKAGIQNLLKNLESKLEGVAFNGAVWSTELLALIPQGKNAIGAADKEFFLNLVFEGLNNMLYLHSLFDQVMHFHVEQMIPMCKKTLNMTTNCLWYLKLMAKNIASISGPLQQNFEYINEYYKTLLLEHFKKTYDLLQQVDKNSGTVRVRKVLFKLGSNLNNPKDLHLCVSLVKLGIEVLHDSATVPQRLLLTFILYAISGFKFIPDWVEIDGMKYLKKMEFVEHLPELLENLGNMQFLFFHPEYMRNAIEQILLYPSEVYKLQNLLDAFLDIKNLAIQAGLGNQCDKMFEDEMTSLLKFYLIEPLSLAIKKDLLSLSLVCDDNNVSNDNVEFKHNFLPLVHVKTLKLITTTFNLHEKLLKEVVKNLRRTARDGDLEWTSICKIKTIAWEKYRMRLDKIDPSEGTISTSLDVLSTFEGLKIFLTSYMFQLHSVTFTLNPGASIASNSKNDYPKIVEIEEFMDFIQADVTYRGSEVLESIFEIKTSDALIRRSFRKSSKSTHQFQHQQSKKTNEDEVENEINIDNENIIDNEQSAYPIIEGSDEPKNSINSPFDDISHLGKSQWSFIEESHKREIKDEESSNSIVAVPSIHSNSKGDKVSGLLNMLKEFLSKKLHEVCELCMFPETRSVFFQATQRWLNSQNAVDNQYPAAQADIVRKEITALMKAGTLSTNPIHRLRFHIMDIGKLVALLLMMFHGAICVRDRALGMLPRVILKTYDSLEEFLISLKIFDKVISEGKLYDRNLDGLAMKNPLSEKFSDMLEEIFKKSIDENKAEHMKSLFIFLPAMSLNHVESMISLKNQHQNTLKSRPFCITEDSFALGTSYLLSMLNQIEKFTGLNWFDSVYKHYNVKFNRIKVTLDTQQTVQATLSRQATTDVEMQRNIQRMETLKETMKEIKLLEYSILCSILFFQFRNTINNIEASSS